MSLFSGEEVKRISRADRRRRVYQGFNNSVVALLSESIIPISELKHQPGLRS